MKRLISLPQIIFVLTNRDRIVNTMNDDEQSFNLPGKAKHGKRYKEVLNKSLFKTEKAVIGKGFGGKPRR